MYEVIGQILKSERLATVGVVVGFAGVALYCLRYLAGFDFTGLPLWVEPTAMIVWVIAIAYLLVRSIKAGASAAPNAHRYLRGAKSRRSKRAADEILIRDLTSTSGLGREVLSYARHHDDNHIWSADPKPRWAQDLLAHGIIRVTDAGFGTIHYRIHPKAWAYMIEYPDKFVCKLGWKISPWSVDADHQDRIEEEIAKA